MNQIKAFTARAGGLANVLMTPIGVISTKGNGVSIHAIWDTGATGTTITSKVVQELGLLPTGFANVHTANGVAQQNTYTVDLALPNDVIIKKITVTEVSALSGGCDALVGMNIINLGDFSVTNYNGNTCFSFRIPSHHEIDYVASPDFGMVKVVKNQSLEDRFRAKRLEEMANKNKNKNKR